VAEKQTCSCGCGAGERGKNRIIFACAGASNTGQISNLAAVQLTDEGYGSLACTSLLAAGAANLTKMCRESDGVVIIDGCPNACASRIAEQKEITPDQHIIITELGIKKSGDRGNITDEEIETVVSRAWEGRCR